jgi:hypothetical protein
VEGLGAVARLVEQGVGGLLRADAGGSGLEDAAGVVEGRRRVGWWWLVREVVVGGFGGEVDVVGVAASGHPDVRDGPY